MEEYQQITLHASGDDNGKSRREMPIIVLLLCPLCYHNTETDVMTRQEFDYFSESVRAKLLAVAKAFGRFGAAGGDDPEDIVQEALTTLWGLYDSGYPVRDAEALAVKITKTVCVAHYRRRRLRHQPLRGDAYEGGAPATAATDLSDFVEIRRRLYAGLSDTERICLDLRNSEGLSLDEIAAATGKPKDSVKTTISAARRKMLEQLKKEL